MSDWSVRPASDDDLPAVLALNATEVQWTSPLNLDQLQQLHRQACYHRVLCQQEQVIGFLLVLPPGREYASDNYRWFSQQLADFWYIDRIVIKPEQAGQGLGPALYRDLFAEARRQGVGQVVCEYNLAPPNVVSERFHQAMGFAELDQKNHNGKQVSLQILRL